jgi:DNA polymerase-1
MKKMSKIIACDTETTGLDPYGSNEERGCVPARPFAFSFTDYDGNSWYYRLQVNPFTREVIRDEEIISEIKKVYEDPKITKVFHNANFDITMCEMLGIHTLGKVFDTRIMAHVNDSSYMTYALKPLCERIFNITDADQKDLIQSVNKARRIGKREGWKLSDSNKADYHLGDPDLCEKYAVTDTERTMNLFWIFEDKYNNDEDYRSVVDMEHELMHIVRGMQIEGARIDKRKLNVLVKYYQDVLSKSSEKLSLMGYGSLNINSPKQLQKVFYEDLEYDKILNKKTGSLSTDANALQLWSNKGCELSSVIMDMKAASHELTTFILPFKDNSYAYNNKGHIALHPNYNTVGPITGRISCNKPNLMNISAPDSRGKRTDVEYRSRESFIPRENCVWYLPDYSQIEVWISMFLSGDEFGKKSLLSGSDMHGTMAEKIWGRYHDFSENKKRYRKIAKSILFGLIYGGGPGVIKNAGGS